MGLGRDRAVKAVVAGLVIGALGLVDGGVGSGSTSVGAAQPGGASGGAAAGEDTPRVPHNNVAAIYDLFAARDESALRNVREQLVSEGYTIDLYEDKIAGSGPGHGNATLDNFVKMADTASVIVINTHGEDFSGDQQSCLAGKGISQCETIPDTSAPATSSAPPRPERSTIVQPFLQVEWYQTWDEVQQAYDRYVRSGKYKAKWLFDPTVYTPPSPASTLIPWRKGDWALSDGKGQQDRSGFGYRPYLGITKAGIKHFFQGKNVDFIDNMACHSMSMAAAFGARSYFGHANQACTYFEHFDEPTLFDRLTGKSGVEARRTDDAFALGGFRDTFFRLDPYSEPVVLSPAVKKVSPRAGGVAKPGKTTTASITFDAAMRQTSADDIVTVSGCGAKVENPKWSSETKLEFDLTVPKDQPEKSMTVTVHEDEALAEPGTADNHHLDGNQSPADKSGVAPNRDDYVYRLSCTNAAVFDVEVRFSGTMTADYTEGGFSYNVRFTWEEVQVHPFQFTDGLVEYLPAEPPTLTASGMTTTSGRTGGPEEACAYSPAPAPVSTITVNAREVPAARARTVDVLATIPGSVREAGGPSGKGQLLASGSCLESGRGPAPFLFYHPTGNFDPGGTLSRAQAAMADGIDLGALRNAPHVVKLPYEYTQPGVGGGSDHVFGQTTLTVSLR